VIASLCAYDLYVASHFTMSLGGKPPHWRLFAGMWKSLAHGRFDLDPPDVAGEAFRHDGRTYSYYGIFPALLRGLASPVVDLGHGGFPQVSCALAAAITVGGFVWAGLRLEWHRGGGRTRFALFLLTAALATPLVVGLALTDAYNEAILWGTAWASLFQVFLVVFAQAPPDGPEPRRALLGMAVTAGLALLSRATSGIFVLVELAAVFAGMAADARRDSLRERLRVPRSAVAAAAAIAVGFLAVQGFVNFKRWGNPLEFRPLRLYEWFQETERGRLQAAHGTFRLDRVGTAACFYLLPETANFLSAPPYLAPAGQPCFSDHAAYDALVQHSWQITGDLLPAGTAPYYDLIDGPRMPISVVSPALIGFALIGLSRLRRSGRDRRVTLIVLLNAFLVAAMLFTLDTLALRYEMDFVPSLLGLGFLGIAPAEPERQGRTRTAGTAVLVLLVAFSISTAHATMMLDKLSKAGVPKRIREDLIRAYLGDPSRSVLGMPDQAASGSSESP
jgi:hypothetical protein